jgi:hypothetical protein
MTETPVVTDQPADGPATEAPVSYEDYWGVNETFKYFLPDGKQYFEVRPMDEGGKSMFQKMTNKGIRMNQRTQDATIDMDPAQERHTLIKQSVVGWLIMQRDPRGEWSPFPCPTDERLRKNNLDVILEKFNPKAIQDLEFFIRQKNPWMQADMDVEEIDKEIDRLVQLKKDVTDQKAGEASSANK